VESVAFRELVEEIEEKGGADAGTLLRLFQEWRVIEARKHLDLADGRVAAITQLDKYMVEGALEVQELQPLFERTPWLIDTSWTEADRQATYTKLLRERYAESSKVKGIDRRLDLFGVRKSLRATVVELKHPKKKLTREDVNQIEEYVDWIRSQVGTGPDSPRYVGGLFPYLQGVPGGSSSKTWISGIVQGSASSSTPTMVKRTRSAGPVERS
jgi:hypothetical protein